MTNGWGFAQDPEDDLGEPLIGMVPPGVGDDVEDGFNEPEPTRPDDEPVNHIGHKAGWAGPDQDERTSLWHTKPGLLMGLGITLLWLGLSFGLALGAQHAAGVPIEWRLGLLLAAISPGGGLHVQSTHWAIAIGTGPLLPGLVILGLWGLGWAMIFANRVRRTGVPLRMGEIGKACAIGLGIHLMVVISAFIIGAMVTVSGQSLWLRPSLVDTLLSLVAFPLVTGVVGVWFIGVIPQVIIPIAQRGLYALCGLGALIGLVILGMAYSYGAHGLALVLATPLALAMGIGVATGAPVIIQLDVGSQAVHAAWGLGGVSGTLPVPVVLPIAGLVMVLFAVGLIWAIRATILATKRRRDGLWIVGIVAVAIILALMAGQGHIANVVAGTTPPPIVAWLSEALHNGMHVPDGALWQLSLGVRWPIALATLSGILLASYGIGVALAGKPTPPWSGQELETSLRSVYKAGLIDQIAFDRGMYALDQAKRAARKQGKATRRPGTTG